jgi:hypothetical protein
LAPCHHNRCATGPVRRLCLGIRGTPRLLWPLALVGISLVLAACASPPTPHEAPGADNLAARVTPDTETDRAWTAPVTPNADELRTLSAEETLRRDAQQYASDVGVDVEEALRRMQYQDEIGSLNAALLANERDTFAGLWVEHQPDFRVIVQFTNGGERTIRPYIKGKAWAGLVEVRQARLTLAELEAVHAETRQAFAGLDFEVSSGLDVQGNRIEVWVTDPAWFERELQAANIQLPDYVDLVKVEGQSAQGLDIFATPSVPGVAFPRQEPVEGVREAMEAELIGELMLVDGCLQIQSVYGDGRYLPIWPPDFTLNGRDEEIEVLDGTGQVMARVGEEVYMGGGEGSAGALPDCVHQQLPPGCTGPYWIVGTGVRPNLRHDSDLFTLELSSTPERPILLLHKKPVLDEWVAGDALLSGKLVLFEPDRCPRVVSESGMTNYLPLWPPEYEARVEGGELEIVDGAGKVVGRAGQDVVLGGGAIPGGWESERYRRLHHELPGDCFGPYWIVE